MIDVLRTSSALRGMLPMTVVAVLAGIVLARPLARRLGIATVHAAHRRVGLRSLTPRSGR